jgi:hypothetical protein
MQAPRVGARAELQHGQQRPAASVAAEQDHVRARRVVAHDEDPAARDDARAAVGGAAAQVAVRRGPEQAGEQQHDEQAGQAGDDLHGAPQEARGGPDREHRRRR